MRVQRLRVTFGRAATVKYISHLDLMRFWERALRRAELPVAYSEGFSPHPQISLAAPLPVGVTSSAELMDIFLSERVSTMDFMRDLSHQLPPGLAVSQVHEVSLALPSIQSQMRAAEYRLELPQVTDATLVAASVRELLDRESIIWQHQRDKEIRSYDLRPLILDLRFELSPAPILLMRLQADNAATGRPDQVASALGLEPLSIERTRLILREPEEAPGDAAAPGLARPT